MKVKDVIRIMSEYKDQEQEIIIAWNDKEWLSIGNDEPINENIWNEAVLVYEDSSLEGFGDDCRWAIQEAKYNLEKEGN